MEEWTVLESFTSEAEARVAESYLRAQGLEVQLLDTHMNAYAPTSRTLDRGMRLLVRQSDHTRARELLQNGSRGTHLEIAGEPRPIEKSPAERWMFWLVVFALFVTVLLSYLR